MEINAKGFASTSSAGKILDVHFYAIKSKDFDIEFQVDESLIVKKIDLYLTSDDLDSPIGSVEEAYLKSFKQKKRLHASCEDYRASATIDLEHDKKDKNKKLNIPIQVLWGKNGVIGKQFNSKKIWQKYSKKKIVGKAIESGHFIPEQNPKQTIIQLRNFFLKQI